ncbi:CHAD domain-containing protein [Brachybacterium sp. AOP43-C2-M15]|uniref:CHAD domain-containing protein n=1 Tax=Brachybacterium sp. AOP43-C2-M15 TaxID=3457661 RepID=UPI0040335575
MTTAEDPLPAYVAQHAARALVGLRHVRGELPVGLVHDTRTSLRRLRATVRTLPAAFVEATAGDADLRRVALAFGGIRDADVLAETLLPLAEEVAGRTAVPPLSTALAEELRTVRLRALGELTAAAQEAAWGRTVGQVEQWIRTPPALPTTDTRRVLDEARDTLRERIADSSGRPKALHSARKAAKRWRYAAELLVPIEPTAAAHLAEAEPVQAMLGALQDTVIGLEFLGSPAVAAGPGDVDPAALGALESALADRRNMLVDRALGLLGGEPAPPTSTR